MNQNDGVPSKRFVSQALTGREVDLDQVILTVRAGMSDEDIAALARLLACYGYVLDQREDHADVASTGGPSSLSTLLCPLYLHALGRRVDLRLVVPVAKEFASAGTKRRADLAERSRFRKRLDGDGPDLPSSTEAGLGD